ncbi:MAG: rod shape-determining protein MreC [Desulfobacterales bacterium]
MFSRRMILAFGGIVFLAVNLLLIAAATRRSVSTSPLGVFLEIAAPFQALATRAIGTLRELREDYLGAVAAVRENRELRRRLEELEQIEAGRREIEIENRRLKELLGFKATLPGEAVAARIIAADPAAWFKTVILDKGEEDGVRKGLPAVTARGAVGQILDASPRRSRLLLLIDYNSAADALVQRSRARGVLKGTSGAECLLDYLQHADDVQVGDAVITSGFDGVYPKGLLLGTVSAVDFQGTDVFKEVRVRPAVDFDKLEEVLVIVEPRPKAALPSPARR